MKTKMHLLLTQSHVMTRIFYQLIRKMELSRSKKLLASNLVLLLILAGCGGTPATIDFPDPTTTIAATGTPTEEIPTSTAEPQRVTQTPTAELYQDETENDPYLAIDPSGQVITLWHPFRESYESALQEVVDEFNQSNHLGIQVQASYQGKYEDLQNRMLTFMNTQDAPSLVVATETQAATYQLGNALVDINHLLFHPDWGLSETDILDFYPGVYQQGVFPSFNSVRLTYPLFGSMNVIYYNIDWLAEMGYATSPATPESFQEAACMATGQPFSGATASGRMGINLNLTPNTFADWSLAFGGKLFDYGTNTYAIESNSVNAALTYLQNLIQRGCATTEPFAESQSAAEGAQLDFSRGVLLFAVDSTNKIPAFRSNIQAEANFNWRIAPLPHTTTNPVSNVQGTGVSISKTTPKEELAAWLFLKYFTQPEIQAKWVRQTDALPVRAGAAEFLGDYFSASPAAQMTLDLLNNSVHEPSVPGYAQVQGLSQEALKAILQGAEVSTVLSELAVDADRILDEQIAQIPESPDPWTEVDPGGQTITFWHQQDPERAASLERIITEFNAINKWGITVVPVSHQSYGEIFQNLFPVLGTEAVPNLVLAYQHHAGAYHEAGGLTPLNSLLDSTRWGLSPNDNEDFYPAIFEQDRFPIFDGNRLGFPFQRSMDILYYNADLMAELGYQSPPTAPEEFKVMSCAASASTGASEESKTGYQFYLDATRFTSWIFAFDGKIFDQDRNQFLWNGTGATAVISFLQDLMDSGCASPVTDRLTAQNAFSEGSLLFMVDSSLHISTITELVSNTAGFEWGVAPLPTLAETPAQNLFGASLSIPDSSPEKELAAWLFIKYFSEPQVQAQWVQKAGYLPVRKSAGEFLQDYLAEFPQYQVPLELLPYGVTAPSLPGYDFVHQEVELALTAIFTEEQEEGEEEINVQEILDSLNATANQILAIHLER